MGSPSLEQWLGDAQAKLQAVGIEGAALEAQLLAAHGLGQSRSWVLAHGRDPLACDLDSLLERRLHHEPLSYITGHREFYGRLFEVGPGVLVPRQDTETLVDEALQQSGGRVLDIGTGSGCVAITLALERPDWDVSACDISDQALEIARKNQRALGANVEFVKSDLVGAFEHDRFRLIVSNPPYIRIGAELPPDVAKYEPAGALYAGIDGLDIYRRLAAEVPRVLSDGGLLAVEIGDGMGADVRDVFMSSGWSLKHARSDLAGRERVLSFAPGKIGTS